MSPNLTPAPTPRDARLVWMSVETPEVQHLPKPETHTPETKFEEPQSGKLESGHRETESNDSEKIQAERLVEALAKDPRDLTTLELQTLATKSTGREKMRTDFLSLKNEKLTENQKIAVDFQSNNHAEWKIGAGDLLPATVREITVVTKDGKELHGVRAPNPDNPNPARVGYYTTEGKYIPIFSGDEITVGKVLNESELQTLNEQVQKKASGKSLAELENGIHTERLAEAEQHESKMAELREKYGVQETGDLEKDFINLSTKIAKDIEKNFGIPWQVTVAQTALETGMGKHVPENNLFGIKGSGQKLKTKEVVNGREITVVDGFASYGSTIDSFLAYARLLTTSPRYQPTVIEHRKNPMAPKEFLRRIIEAGYATDPRYVAKATSLMAKHGISMEA